MPLLALPTEILSYIIQLAITKPPFTRPYETFNLVNRLSRADEYGTLSEAPVKALALSCHLLSRLVLKEASSEVVFPSMAQVSHLLDRGSKDAIRMIALPWYSGKDSEADMGGFQLRLMKAASRLTRVEIEFLRRKVQSPALLAEGLSSAAHLEELTLKYGDVPPDEEEECLLFLRTLALSQLKRLNIVYLHHITSQDLLLNQFPRLSHLALSDLHSISASDLRALLSRAPLTLRHLALPSMNTAEDCALTGLIPDLVAERLQTLAIENVEGLFRIIGDMRQYRCLQELDFGDTRLDVFDPVDLPLSLRKLRLKLDSDLGVRIDNLQYLKQLPDLLVVGLVGNAPDRDTLAFFRKLREEGRIRVEGKTFGSKS